MDVPQTHRDPPISRGNGEGGDEPWRNGDDGSSDFASRIPTIKLLIYFLIASLAVGFASLVVIYVIRGADKLNYPFTVPASLWVSTLVILLSSVSLHTSIKALKRSDAAKFRSGLWATFILGAIFVASQTFAWLFVLSSITGSAPAPIRNLFFVLTGMHALHVLAGLAWIGAVTFISKTGRYSSNNRIGPELCAVYWHFMGATWVVFFAVMML